MLYASKVPHWRESSPNVHAVDVEHGAFIVVKVGDLFRYSTTVGIRSIDGAASTLDAAKAECEEWAILSGMHFVSYSSDNG